MEIHTHPLETTDKPFRLDRKAGHQPLAMPTFFKTSKIPGKFDLHRLIKANPHLQALYSHLAQQTLTRVAESFKSYIGLLKGFWSKEGSCVNADCHGAANVLRKVAALGINLNGVTGGALIAPLKVCIWTVQKSPSL